MSLQPLLLALLLLLHTGSVLQHNTAAAAAAAVRSGSYEISYQHKAGQLEGRGYRQYHNYVVRACTTANNSVAIRVIQLLLLLLLHAHARQHTSTHTCNLLAAARHTVTTTLQCSSLYVP
jgi:hypothetical protein